MLVGTYTEGTSSEGIYLYRFNEKKASGEQLSMARTGNPSFVIASPDGNRAFCVNEYNDGRQGVSAFYVSKDKFYPLGSALIPKEEVDGEDPCNLLFLESDLVTANYSGGSVAVFHLEAEGEIMQLSQTFSGNEEEGPSSHMHCAVLAPDKKSIFITDLGKDRIYQSSLIFITCPRSIDMGKPDVAWQSEVSGRGPRHLIFSQDGRFAYLLCELSDELLVFSYDQGNLTLIQSLLAYDGEGHGSADLHLSPDGQFLYTSHRLKEDGIAIFSVNKESGMVTPAGYQKTGKHPRNFAISPDGKYLLCACRDDNRIEIYKIDKKTGSLTPTNHSIEVGAPVCIQFLP